MGFFEKFYSLFDGMTYDNIDFDPKSYVMAVMFAWIGVAIGFIVSYYISAVLGGFIKKLHAYRAFSAEDAETLETLGVGRFALVRLSLREKSTFRRTVLAAGGEEGKKADIDKLAFYIPEEKADEAIERYCKKGNRLWVLILCLILSAAIALLAIVYGPDLMKIVDNLLANFKG